MKKLLLIFVALLLLSGTVHATGQVQIDGDGSIPPYSFDGLQPYFDQNGNTMFPMVHFDELFKGNVSYEFDDNKVVITKNVLDVITVVSITTGSNILLKDGQEIVMDTTPVQKDGTIYIPLRFVGNELGYGVQWNEKLGRVKFYQYTSAYIYVWNENEDSSPDGLRYSYIISGDRTSDMSKIKANATSDYEEVQAVINMLPQGAGILTTALYSAKGYKVPYEIYNGITSRVFQGGYKSSYTTLCLDEIPSIIKDVNDFANGWYSQELFALDEEALYHSEGQVYRFSSFPAFSNPIVVRIEMKDDGTAVIHYKVGKGSAGAHSGGILRSEKAELNRDETQEFLDLLIGKDYWNLPIEIKRMGFDGHNVIIEGAKDGVYHIIDRWVPEKDDPVRSMEEYFFNLIKEKFTD